MSEHELHNNKIKIDSLLMILILFLISETNKKQQIKFSINIISLIPKRTYELGSPSRQNR